MPEFYQFNEAGNMKESAPTRCPNGHPLGPNTVLVGALLCLCHPPATVHRTWRCTACDACMTQPACSRTQSGQSGHPSLPAGRPEFLCAIRWRDSCRPYRRAILAGRAAAAAGLLAPCGHQHPAGGGADPSGTSSRRRLRNDAGMARRPNESVAQWFERAIVTNSVAAVQQETLSEGFFANPAAREAIDQRAREAAADLELAAAAFHAERYQAKPEG